MTKFATPFSGASDLDIGGQDKARAGDMFPSDQVDESRKGAMRGDAKFSMDCGCEKMQSTVDVPTGYTGWKKMETW